MALSLSTIIAKGYAVKSVLGIIGLGAAIVLVASGWLKAPSTVEAVAAGLKDHQAQMDHTNRKLDVLICLQAKLDTPIRCVARETERK